MPVEWLTPDWPAPAAVRALSTLRGGGVSTGRYASLNLGDHVRDCAGGGRGESPSLARRRRVCRRSLCGSLRCMACGSPIWTPHRGTSRPLRRRADGAVTRVPGRICAILTADCLPVLLASESGDAVAAAHAGWRGLAGGVIEAAVRALAVAPDSLLAWLGPAIGPGHFEVGAEVRDAAARGAIRGPRRRSSPMRAAGSWPTCRGSRGAGSSASGVDADLRRRRMHLCAGRSGTSPTGATARPAGRRP